MSGYYGDKKSVRVRDGKSTDPGYSGEPLPFEKGEREETKAPFRHLGKYAADGVQENVKPRPIK
jgi:hypothetical protein